MRKIAVYTLGTVLLTMVVSVAFLVPVNAQTTYTQGIVLNPASGTLLPNESITITCFNEPAHPLGVNGHIQIGDPAGDVWDTGVQPFTVGDFDGDSNPDDSLTVIFPDDFPGASTGLIGEYMIFCDFWSGPTGDTDPGEATPIVGAFWQYIWVSFNVVPESIIGAVAPVGVGLAAFMGYRYYNRRSKSIAS